MIESVYSCKKIAPFNEGPVEIFADEIVQITNKEVIYSDIFVQMFFNMDNLPSQTIFNEETLEASPLDTPANYRTRFQVSHLHIHDKNINHRIQSILHNLGRGMCIFWC